MARSPLSTSPRPLPRPLVLTLYPRIPLQPPRRQDHKHIRVIQNNENKYLNQKKRQQCNVNTLCSVFFFLSHSYTSDIFFLILIAFVQRSGLNFNKLFKEKKTKMDIEANLHFVVFECLHKAACTVCCMTDCCSAKGNDTYESS